MAIEKNRSSRDHMFYWSIYRWETPINSVWIEVTKRKENWHLGTLGGQNVIMAIPSELEFVLVQVCQMAPILWKLLTTYQTNKTTICSTMLDMTGIFGITDLSKIAKDSLEMHQNFKLR